MALNTKKPLVGFFPLCYNLAETGRAILVAKRYVELGGRVIFFSHGGKYEHLIEDFGYDMIRVKPLYSEESSREIMSINRGEKKGISYPESFIRESVKEEIIAYKKSGIKMVVSFVNVPCSISARAAKIPLVCVSPAPGSFYFSIPDNYENILTRLFPQFLKIPLQNWLLYSVKASASFNNVSKEYGLKPFKSAISVYYGDVTLSTNFLEFINILPKQQIFPDKDYVGIISLEELFSDIFSDKQSKKINFDIQNHVKKPGRSILLSMGSSGDKMLFIKILKVLNTTSYNVVALYADILKEEELPDLNDNILLRKFAPSISRIQDIVDLSIIHGGQGTVYNVAYSGKPFIGFPMQFEQHLNLEKLVGHGTGLILSRKYLKENQLLTSIEKIFDNYESYFNNAQLLAKKLPPPKGDLNAAKRIVEILEEHGAF